MLAKIGIDILERCFETDCLTKYLFIKNTLKKKGFILKVKIGAGTDRGHKRILNEDSLCLNEAIGLFVLADGMGGHKAGEVASRLAVEIITKGIEKVFLKDKHSMLGEYREEFSKENNVLASSVRLANIKIYEIARKRSECSGMGTTVVSVLLRNSIMSMAHVGDSRIYLIRDNLIDQLTTDHSIVAEQLKRGLISEKEARESKVKNVITRALGMDDSVEVDFGEQVIMKNDCVLMCSDGLYDMVEDDEILSVILGCSGKPQKACDSLIALANEHGGNDNISVILLQF